MSSTTSSAAATSSISQCGSTLYDTPVQDASCAIAYGGNHTDIMVACCKDAKVVAYYDNCGLYCQALDQSVADLANCMFDEGAAWADVFCSPNGTATVTATKEAAVPATASASVIASGGSKVDGDDDKSTKTDDSSDSDATGTSTSDSSKSTNSDNAAPGTKPPSGISTLGLAIGALLFSATALGAFQI
ncbi:Fc.00g115190.m01.CDS01 [Cosmosporella sp. VM-42]